MVNTKDTRVNLISLVNTIRVIPDNRLDFHPLAYHTTKLRHFNSGDICEYSTFPFSLDLMFDQTLSNLILCLTISQKKVHKKFAQTS